MDEQIGRLRAELRTLAIAENTLILFAIDNGPADSQTKKGVASAGPFRGHKHTMYEGGLRVPALAGIAVLVMSIRYGQYDISPLEVVQTITHTLPKEHEDRIVLHGILLHDHQAVSVFGVMSAAKTGHIAGLFHRLDGFVKSVEKIPD